MPRRRIIPALATLLVLLAQTPAGAYPRPGRTELVSGNAAGQVGNDFSTAPSISADGRYVAFDSDAKNLVPNDTNGSADSEGASGPKSDIGIVATSDSPIVPGAPFRGATCVQGSASQRYRT